MKVFVIFFFTCLSSLYGFGQVSFDDGKTFYTDSSQTTLCNGKFRAFYPGFKLKSSTTYLDGKLHGELIEYYQDSKIKAKVNYVNGLLDGESIEYYPETNVIKSKFHFTNGLKNGECTTYNEQGEILEKKFFVNGIPEK